jgi:hypothetical protein
LIYHSFVNVNKKTVFPNPFFAVDEQSRQEQFSALNGHQVQIHDSSLVQFYAALNFSHNLKTLTRVQDADVASNCALDFNQIHLSVNFLMANGQLKCFKFGRSEQLFFDVILQIKFDIKLMFIFMIFGLFFLFFVFVSMN